MEIRSGFFFLSFFLSLFPPPLFSLSLSLVLFFLGCPVSSSSSSKVAIRFLFFLLFLLFLPPLPLSGLLFLLVSLLDWIGLDWFLWTLVDLFHLSASFVRGRPENTFGTYTDRLTLHYILSSNLSISMSLPYLYFLNLLLFNRHGFPVVPSASSASTNPRQVYHAAQQVSSRTGNIVLLLLSFLFVRIIIIITVIAIFSGLQQVRQIYIPLYKFRSWSSSSSASFFPSSAIYNLALCVMLLPFHHILPIGFAF